MAFAPGTYGNGTVKIDADGRVFTWGSTNPEADPGWMSAGNTNDSRVVNWLSSIGVSQQTPADAPAVAPAAAPAAYPGYQTAAPSYNTWLTVPEQVAQGFYYEGLGESYEPATVQADRAKRQFWEKLAPQFQVTARDENTGEYTQEFDNFIAQKEGEGYNFVTKYMSGNRSQIGLRGPDGALLYEGPVERGGVGNAIKTLATDIVIPIAAMIIGANAFGNFVGGGTGAGAGAGAGAAGAGIAEGMAPGVLAPASAAELTAVNALTTIPTASAPFAVDYSFATQPVSGTGAGLGTTAATGAPGAIDYSLATQPVAGTGAGLAAGTAPVVGTGAGLALAPGASPALGAPSSFVNTATTGAAGAAGATGAGAGTAGAAGAGAGTAGAAGAGAGTAAATGAASMLPAATDSSFWGPLITSLASLYGGSQAASAAEEAARINAEATNRAIDLQERMYKEGVERQRPFLEEGTAAFNRLAALSRGGPEAAQNFLTMEPGYGFRLGEGLKALERTQAARGNLLSGGAIKAGQRYAQDVASQEYSNAYNRLAQMAGIGPQAAGVANTLGQSYASNVGNLATQQGGTAANALLTGAAARQSAYGDVGRAWGQYFAPQPVINYLGGGGYGR